MLKMSFFRRLDVKALQMAQDLAAKNPPTCYKCKGQAMEIGYCPLNVALRWEPLRWFRSKPEGRFGIKIPYREYTCVVSFRCPSCGYLESYAPDLNE